MEPIQVALRKQYTRAQRTKPSLQILKKLSMRENVVRTVIFQRLMRENDRGTMEAGKKCYLYGANFGTK
jgi:hypothetical protein